MLRKILCALGLTLSFTASGLAQSAAQIDYRALGAPLPPVRIVTEDKKVFTEKDLLQGENVFIMLFNPTCDHCHEVTHMLGANAGRFKDGQLYLMAAPGMLDHLEFFSNTTRHKQHPVIRVGVDSTGFIEKTFNYQSLPQLLIYDRSRKLARSLSGSIVADSLLPYLGPAARQYNPRPVGKTGPFPVRQPSRKKRGR
jgi:thiol-disulfide isomerase/thioredoxin